MGKLIIFTKGHSKLSKYERSAKSALLTISIEWDRIAGFHYESTKSVIHAGKIHCPECGNAMFLGITNNKYTYQCKECGLIVDTERL